MSSLPICIRSGDLSEKCSTAENLLLLFILQYKMHLISHWNHNKFFPRFCVVFLAVFDDEYKQPTTDSLGAIRYMYELNTLKYFSVNYRPRGVKINDKLLENPGVIHFYKLKNTNIYISWNKQKKTWDWKSEDC